jgi:transposase
MERFDLTDLEWSVIEPLLPTKVRGVKRVDDRRALNGIFWRLRTGAPWADILSRYGPHTTCLNCFNRWRRAGHWARILEAVSAAHEGDVQMIDSSSIRAHNLFGCPPNRRGYWSKGFGKPPALNQAIDGRDHNQGQHRRGDHAADHRHGDALHQLGAGAMAP